MGKRQVRPTLGSDPRGEMQDKLAGTRIPFLVECNPSVLQVTQDPL